MSRRSTVRLTVVCGAVAVLLAFSAEARAGLFDCLFGTPAPSQTTYAPPYVPNNVAPAYQPAAAPACGSCGPSVSACVPSCSPCVPSCSPCAPSYSPCAPSYSPCAPSCSSCNYYPTTAYYPAIPQQATVYQSVTAGYPVTTYRPMLGTYQTRLVPYTTYRPVYVPAISYQPCTSYVSNPCGSPCGSSSPCAGGACGATIYGPPAGGCASCGVPAASAPSYNAAPSPSTSAPTRKTFEEKVQKPATGDDMKPIPAAPDAKLNSSPAPALVDPNNRTASLTSRQAVRVEPAGFRLQELPPLGNEVWRPARD